jgi:uncharacterized protein YtpQ (UPF0354 family)
MIKYIVDRVESNYAICFDENNQYSEIPVESFGFKVHEGMVVLYDEQTNSYTFDLETTEKLLDENKNKLRKLFDR